MHTDNDNESDTVFKELKYNSSNLAKQNDTFAL